MSVFTKAFFDLLRTDTTLCNMLAYYPPHTGSTKPAIFTADPPPDNADMPYIIITGHIMDNALDTKSSTGRDFIRDIRCYTDATKLTSTYEVRSTSTYKVEEIAERVRSILHNKTIAVEGYSQIGKLQCSARQGPIEPDAYGQIVEVRYKGHKI